MSKKALIIIAIIILIPVLITIAAVSDWKRENEVVAEYGDNINTVIYGKLTLHEVPDNDSYMAEPGVFIGKVGDRLLGAGLYTLKYDTSGEIWALVTEKGTVIYTESGSLPAAAYAGESVTRIFFDSFQNPVASKENVALLTEAFSLSSSSVSWTPDKDEKTVSREIHYCYDGCAVSTVTVGTLIYFDKTGRWFYLPSEGKKSAEEEAAASGNTEAVYTVYRLESASVRRLLKSLFLSDNIETRNSVSEK